MFETIKRSDFKAAVIDGRMTLYSCKTISGSFEVCLELQKDGFNVAVYRKGRETGLLLAEKVNVKTEDPNQITDEDWELAIWIANGILAGEHHQLP